MKKIILAALALLVLVSTTGCMKYSYEIDIDEDGNIKYSETQAVNVKAMEKYGTYNSEDLKTKLDTTAESLTSSGYNVTEYNDANYKGLTRTRKYKSEYFTKNIISPYFVFKGNSPITTDSYFGGRKVYSINMTYNINQDVDRKDDTNANFLYTLHDINKFSLKTEEADVDIDAGADTDTDTDITEDKKFYTETTNNEKNIEEKVKNLVENDPALLPDLSLVIKVPGKVRKQNANKVINANEYQWIFSADEPTLVSLEYETRDAAALGIIISMTLLIAGLIFLVYKTRE